MSWKQQKLVSVLAIAAALVVNCLPLYPAKGPVESKVATALP